MTSTSSNGPDASLSFGTAGSIANGRRKKGPSVGRFLYGKTLQRVDSPALYTCAELRIGNLFEIDRYPIFPAPCGRDDGSAR